MTTLTIAVTGRPAPQGSKDLGSAGQMLESSPHLPAWRKAVYLAALRALKDAGVGPDDRPLYPAGTAVMVQVSFFLSRPASTKFPHHPTTPPDLDKLIRGVFDAITSAKVWADDDQPCRVFAGKHWTHEGREPGATIIISNLNEETEA